MDEKKKGPGRGLGKGIGALIPSSVHDEKDEKASKPAPVKKETAKKVNSKPSAKKTAKATKAKSDKEVEIEFFELSAEREAAEVRPEKQENNIKKEGAEILIKTSYLEPNKNQPRKEFDIEAMQELADSIKKVGIIQPILVQKKNDKYYEIIAGERRWRAAKMAKLKEVPVIVREYTPKQVMEVALIENIQREDLNPIEEAKAFENLIKEYDLKQEELAKRVSKSRAQISNIMRLLKLDDRIQILLIEGRLSAGHARALLAIEDKELQFKAAVDVLNHDLSVRATEKLIKAYLSPKPEKKLESKSASAIVYRNMEEKMGNILGSKVSIKTKNGKKGKIEIEYYSQEELERLYAFINTKKFD